MRRILAFSVAIALALVVLPRTSIDAAQPSQDVQVSIAPIGPTGVAGFALLSPREGSTAVQVVASGAPAGTSAAIHTGNCAAISPSPVGLLGELGPSGQSQVVVPLDFATLTDGGHAVAFHPGVDFATVLGCGEIPAVIAPPEPIPTAPPTIKQDGSYISPSYGFEITWDERWSSFSLELAPGLEGVGLTNGTSSLTLIGFAQPGGDAQECVRSWSDRIDRMTADNLIRDAALAIDASGQVLSGGDASRAWSARSYTTIREDGSAGVDQVDYVDCRRLSSSTMLEIRHFIPVGGYTVEAAARDELLTRLTLGTTPDPAPPPDPTTAPAPTADTACAGVPEWFAATTQRLDRINALDREAADAFFASATKGDTTEYANKLAANGAEVQAMAAAQERGPTPPAASAANEQVVAAMRILIDAAFTLYRYYTGGYNADDLSAGRRLADDGLKLLAEARRAAGDIAGGC